MLKNLLLSFGNRVLVADNILLRPNNILPSIDKWRLVFVPYPPSSLPICIWPAMDQKNKNTAT